MQTLDPEGAVAFGAEDAWEATMLMLEGLERSNVHKEEKPFGRQVGVLKTCC